MPQSGEDDLQPDLHLQPDLAEPGAAQLELPRPVRPQKQPGRAGEEEEEKRDGRNTQKNIANRVINLQLL